MTTGTVTPKHKPALTIWTAPTPTNNSVFVLRMKLDLKCGNCGKTWGLWVTNEALPPNWDECRECQQKKREENNRQISQLYRADISGRRKEQ